MLHYLDKIYFSYNESQQLNRLDQHYPKSLLPRLEGQLQSLKRGMTNVTVEVATSWNENRSSQRQVSSCCCSSPQVP